MAYNPPIASIYHFKTSWFNLQRAFVFMGSYIIRFERPFVRGSSFLQEVPATGSTAKNQRIVGKCLGECQASDSKEWRNGLSCIVGEISK